ncbi:hypothetical protein BpHYR1_005063 [Brachionus plicatilis]|uniref:Uncharacterized protein n=1 Tax=Brachionus plicatilis TaxID=10195 RepID=A0A3M7T669_BRAPC|nr:hypothetical protein BpHYR1_005063 [Brachionus plicatilis]
MPQFIVYKDFKIVPLLNALFLFQEFETDFLKLKAIPILIASTSRFLCFKKITIKTKNNFTICIIHSIETI